MKYIKFALKLSQPQSSSLFCLKNIAALCASFKQKNRPLVTIIRENKITHAVSCGQGARKLDASLNVLGSIIHHRRTN